MPGQIIKRGDNYFLLRVFLGRDGAGKRRYLNHPFHGTKKKANDELTKLLNARNTGQLIEPVKVTLNEYLNHWLESAAKTRVRRRTHEFYKDVLERYIRPHLGPLLINRLTPLDIQAAYAKLLEKLSPKTIRHAHGALRSALNQAVKWRFLSNNPALYVDLPRNRRKEMSALSPAQATAFLQAAAKDRWGTLFAVALTTGMRPSEYLALQWKDVDFHHGTVAVRRTVSFQNGGQWEFAEPKTAKSARLIPLPPTVSKMLAAHRQEQEATKKRCDYESRDLVFEGDCGQPIELRNLVRRHFKDILEIAGLPNTLRLYDLRHSCASLLLTEGEHPKVVSERLGHASVTLTLDTYSHVLPTMQQQAAERLETALFSTPPKPATAEAGQTKKKTARSTSALRRSEATKLRLVPKRQSVTFVGS